MTSELAPCSEDRRQDKASKPETGGRDRGHHDLSWLGETHYQGGWNVIGWIAEEPMRLMLR